MDKKDLEDIGIASEFLTEHINQLVDKPKRMKKIEAIEYLCEKLDSYIYFPVRMFINSINKEEKTYDFGNRKEIFKGIIEDIINRIGVD